MGGSVPNPNPNTNTNTNTKANPDPNPNSVNSKNINNSITMNGGSFSQHHHYHHPHLHHQLRDTTLTKVFVGGLAWETQRDTMKRHFEQFGEILEAVVIMDKNTGRSKGYGFVTFRDPEAARRACMDATPVIDGRRANCNLASLGANQRPRTPVSNRVQVGLMSPYSSAANSHMAGPTFIGNPAGAAAPVYPPHHIFPNYQIYGYSPYMQDYGYNQGVYAPYGGVNGYPHVYGGGPALYSPYANMHFVQPAPAGGYPSTNTISSVPTSNGVAASPPPSIAIPSPPLFHHHPLTTPNVAAEQSTS